jgi:hypothetical protein
MMMKPWSTGYGFSNYAVNEGLKRQLERSILSPHDQVIHLHLLVYG